MTPLAKILLNDYCRIGGRHRPDWLARIQSGLLHAQQFEVTKIMPAADLLVQAELKRHSDADGSRLVPGIDQRSVFLPAPITWLEWAGPAVDIYTGEPGATRRFGSLVREQDGQALCHGVSFDGGQLQNDGSPLLFPLGEHADFGTVTFLDGIATPPPPVRLAHVAALFYAILAVINTPRVFARREHPIGYSMQRKLKAAADKAGAAFQPLPWTEILLEITPPVLGDQDTTTPDTQRLAGARALHFCRAFLRVRCGRVERVRAHWRGDPALGIRRRSYRIEA